MNIYDYVTHMNSFLKNQSEFKLSNSVSASLVMRFRRVTTLSVLQSRQFLTQFFPTQQVQLVQVAEQYYGEEILHDPIEDDSAIRPFYESACNVAAQQVEVWHQQKLEEPKQRSPEFSEPLYSKRGLSHRYWAKVKQLLWEQHQIEWKSPAEMNPWIIFD